MSASSLAGDPRSALRTAAPLVTVAESAEELATSVAAAASSATDWQAVMEEEAASGGNAG